MFLSLLDDQDLIVLFSGFPDHSPCSVTDHDNGHSAEVGEEGWGEAERGRLTGRN